MKLGERFLRWGARPDGPHAPARPGPAPRPPTAVRRPPASCILHPASGCRGFTLIECLAALIILSIGLAAVLSIFVAGVSTHKRAVDQTTSGLVAQKVLAELHANCSDDYLKRLIDRASRNQSGAALSIRRRVELKNLADSDYPDYRYDLVLQPIDPHHRDAYAVTLSVRWFEGGVDQQAVFQTVVLRKMDR